MKVVQSVSRGNDVLRRVDYFRGGEILSHLDFFKVIVGGEGEVVVNGARGMQGEWDSSGQQRGDLRIEGYVQTKNEREQ